jgi:hypothetical protein
MRKLLLLFALLILVGCSPEDPEFLLFGGGDNTVEAGDKWTDPGAGLDMKTYWIFADEVEGTVDTSELGTYEITYTAYYKDEPYYITREVEVVDTTPPEIGIIVFDDTITVGESWGDPGITCTDNYAEYCEFVSEGEVDTSVPGTYIITYYVRDENENVASATREVTVLPDE